MQPGHDVFQQVVERVHPRVAQEFPTAQGPLIATLKGFADGMTHGQLAVVSDLVWQTAPTAELIRAFAPPAGREKLRPIEGYEMQAEHAGFEVAERVVVEPKAWHPFFDQDPAKKHALAADARGAARVCVLVLRKA